MSVASRSIARSQQRSLRAPIVRDRSRLIAGVGIIALCALLGAVLYNNASHRQQVLALAHDIKAGQTIQRSDLKSVGIAAEGSVATVRTEDARDLMGKVATSNLSAGTILTEDAVAPIDPPKPGEAVVGAALKRGQFPTSLRVGDNVLVVVGASTASSTSQVSTPDPIRATVAELGEFDETTGVATVSLKLSNENAATVAAAGSASSLSLAVLGQ